MWVGAGGDGVEKLAWIRCERDHLRERNRKGAEGVGIRFRHTDIHATESATTTG